MNILLLLKLVAEYFGSYTRLVPPPRQSPHSVRVLTCVIKDGRFNGAVFEIGISGCNVFKIALVKECVFKKNMFKVHLCEPVEKMFVPE